MTTTRREFLIGAASSIATATLVGPGCGGDPEMRSGGSNSDGSDMPDASEPDEFREPDVERLPDTRLELRTIVDEFFMEADFADVRAIGREYLRRFDTSRSVLDDLSPTIELIADRRDLNDALTALDEAIISDFDQIQLYSIGGWQLAETEGRLCGLAYYLFRP